MSNRGVQRKGVIRKNKMLHASIKLFLEQGYEKTSTIQIAKAAGMSQTSFFASFENKEAVLLELVRIMFASQFVTAEKLIKDADSPVMLYAMETALQLHITELSESLRELYVMAYSLPSTSEYIYRSTTEKLEQIFSPYMEGQDREDFYEMEIASASIMRGFMAVPCDESFTMHRKLSRYLYCCLKLYGVPPEMIRKITQQVCSVNLRHIAQKIIDAMEQSAEESLQSVMETDIVDSSMITARFFSDSLVQFLNVEKIPPPVPD